MSTWRDHLKIHPACELFPRMSTDELRALGEDICKNDLLEPIKYVTRDGRIIVVDGQNRLDAMELVGLPVIEDGRMTEANDFVELHLETDAEIADYVISANIHRRHLTGEQKRELIAKVLKRQPASSDRTIANITNVDHKTVAPIRADLERRGEIPHVEERTDTKGRQQPVNKTEAKQLKRAAREAELGKAQVAGNLALPDKRYGVILADPEWRFAPWSRETGMDRAADNHYPTSTTEVIAARPVEQIAADDCVLFLWGTVPMLPDALAVMVAWGFEYRSNFTWGKNRIGTGYWNRNKHEHLLVGVKGNIPAPAMGTQWESLLVGEVGAHSEKPDWQYELIEAYFPTLPKIELNARRSRPGWDAWGLDAPAGEIAEAAEAAE